MLLPCLQNQTDAVHFITCLNGPLIFGLLCPSHNSHVSHSSLRGATSIDMGNQITVTSFQHQALPDSTTHIRLLEIIECEPNKSIVCELSVSPIETAPPYYAISYTWGDAELTVALTVSGRRMTVRQNCEYALRQAFNSNASRHFWIDSVCIDQTSTQEKNHQVAMMGRIYKRATHVFACVGPHMDDSEILLDVLDGTKSLSMQLHSAIRIAEVDPTSWAVPNSIPGRNSLALRCFLTMPAARRKRLADAFIAFMRRPYFSRFWILQEMLLAKSISYCCGMDIQYFNDIMAIGTLVDFWINEKLYMDHWRNITRKTVSFMSRRRYILRRQKVCQAMKSETEDLEFAWGSLALAIGMKKSLDLSSVLIAMPHFHCADPRDKLYGILSLVNWKDIPVPVPDYDKNSLEIAVEVLGMILADKSYAAGIRP